MLICCKPRICIPGRWYSSREETGKLCYVFVHTNQVWECSQNTLLLYQQYQSFVSNVANDPRNFNVLYCYIVFNGKSDIQKCQISTGL